MTYTGPPPGAWSAPPAPAQPLRPGAGRFVLAGGIAVVAIAVAVVLAVRAVVQMGDAVQAFDRFVVPGEMEVEVTSAGGYSIYAEGPGLDDGARPFVAVEVTPATGGEPLVQRPYGAHVFYDIHGHQGVGVYSVHVPEPGRYRVAADVPAGLTVAFGRGVGGALARGFVAAVTVGGLGVLAGGALAIVTGVQRGRARRARLAASVPWAPAAPWGAAPPWGAPSPWQAPPSWGAPPAEQGGQAPPPPPPR